MDNRFTLSFVRVAVIFSSFIFVNCERAINLPITDIKPSIVIFGVLEPDSVPKIFVSESQPYYTYLDTELEYALIEDAQVEISDGKQSWQLLPDTITYLHPDDLNRRSTQSYNYLSKNPFSAYAFTTNMTLQAGVNYEVSVHKNDDTAKAKCTVLSPLNITLSKRPFFSTDRVYDVNFEVSDKPHGQYFRTLFAYDLKAYFCNGFEVLDSFEMYYYDINKRHQFNEESLYNNFIHFFHRCITTKCANSFADIWKKTDSIPVQVSIQLIDSNLINYIAQIEYQEEIENHPYNSILEPAPVVHPVENGLGILTSVATSKWETFWVKCE